MSFKRTVKSFLSKRIDTLSVYSYIETWLSFRRNLMRTSDLPRIICVSASHRKVNICEKYFPKIKYRQNMQVCYSFGLFALLRFGDKCMGKNNISERYVPHAVSLFSGLSMSVHGGVHTLDSNVRRFELCLRRTNSA